MTPRNRFTLFASLLVSMVQVDTKSFAIEDGAFPVQSNLSASAAKVEITPPAGTPVVGHVRETFEVRDPLHAGILLLDDGNTRAAILTFDLIDAWEDLVRDVREAVSEVAEIPQKHILVTASHNHSGPRYVSGSDWGQEVISKIQEAARTAAKEMRPVSVGYAEDEIGFGINRRKVINNQAVVRLNPEGPNDPRVKVLRFDDGQSLTPVAVIMHAVCHPCFFTWGDNATPPYPTGYPKISADFPGEAQRFVEKVYDNETISLFLQGCAGDIRPNLPGYPYRCADESDIQWAGRDLGGAVVRALARSLIREERDQRPPFYRIACASKRVTFPGKEGPIEAELMALKVGPYLFLTMPGEPMVEYGFKIEAIIADRAIPIIVGYANGGIGYLATADSYEVGGYEPERSRLTPEAEEVFYKELGFLADEVIGDVFRTFSKHPSDLKKDEQNK